MTEFGVSIKADQDDFPDWDIECFLKPIWNPQISGYSPMFFFTAVKGFDVIIVGDFDQGQTIDYLFEELKSYDESNSN